MYNKFKRIIINEGKIKGIVLAISIITFLIIAPTSSAEPPMPINISGYVLMSDGITQAPQNTCFNITDITSGYYIEGVTGGPPGWSGYYWLLSWRI